LVTVAVKAWVSPTTTVAEGGERVTTTLVVLIVKVRLDDWLGSPVEVAVITSVPPVGMVAGAVKLVMAPLAVCAGTKLPHTPIPVFVQLTVQSIPRSLVSSITVALRASWPPVTMEVAAPCGPVAVMALTFRLDELLPQPDTASKASRSRGTRLRERERAKLLLPGRGFDRRRFMRTYFPSAWFAMLETVLGQRIAWRRFGDLS